MIELSTVLIIIICLLNIIVFILGYLLGKINNIRYDNTNIARSFVNKNQESKNILHNKLSIDEGKIVTKIDTSNLEKKYDKLGDDKVSEENISSSINKLKSMKK